MSQLNIESLLQATAPRADRTFVDPGRGDSGDSAFGDHFAQAKSPVEPSRKIEPQPAARYAGPPEGRKVDDARPQETSNPTDEARPNDAASAQPEAKDASAPPEDSSHKTPSSHDAESAQSTPPFIEPAAAKAKLHGEKNSDSSDDSDKTDEMAEAAVLVSSQAIAKATDVQTIAATCGGAIENYDRSTDASVTPEKPQPNGNARQATKENGAAKADAEVLSAEEAKLLTEASATATSTESAVQLPSEEHQGAHAKSKTNGRPTSRREDAKDSVDSDAKAHPETESDNFDSISASLASPDEPQAKAERPTRAARISAIKKQAIETDSDSDESTGATRAAPRADVVKSTEAPTAGNQAAAAAIAAGKVDAATGAPQKSEKSAAVRSEALAHPLGRLSRGSGRVGSGDDRTENRDLPQIDVARFVGRVSKAFQTAQQRGGTLQLRLSPPELGSLRLELNLRDGAMSASLQTETDAARRILLDHLPALRDRLAEQNIRIERFDVDVRREDNGGQADGRMLHQHRQQQRDQQQPLPRDSSPRNSRRPAVAELSTAPRPIPPTSTNGLNVVA